MLRVAVADRAPRLCGRGRRWCETGRDSIEQGGPMADNTHGWTADGWEGVRDAFDQNFADGTEVGAAFSVYHRGEKKADLWGGVADRATGRSWDEDSVIPVYSTTK